MRYGNINEMVSKQKKVLELLSNAEIDFTELKKQVVDEDVLNFYCSRFNIFCEDGFADAIDVYLKHMDNDKSINQITKLRIIYAAKSYRERICAKAKS